MNLLLDTHALLWWLQGAPLEQAALDAIADTTNLVAVSSASVWEISIKRSIGKLRFKASIVDAIEAEGFTQLPVTARHAEGVGSLPPIHRDPFDRLLIAQAQHEQLVFVTRDPTFDEYDVDVLRC